MFQLCYNVRNIIIEFLLNVVTLCGVINGKHLFTAITAR